MFILSANAYPDLGEVISLVDIEPEQFTLMKDFYPCVLGKPVFPHVN